MTPEAKKQLINKIKANGAEIIKEYQSGLSADEKKKLNEKVSR